MINLVTRAVSKKLNIIMSLSNWKQKMMHYSSWIYFVGIVFHFSIAKLGLDVK